MRFHLPFPSSWSVEERDGWRRAKIPHLEGGSTMVLEVGPLVPLPLSITPATIAAYVGRDLPEGTTAMVLRVGDVTSARGWPTTAVDAQVVDAAGGVRERRRAVVYRLLDAAATVLLRGSPDDAWEALRTSLGELMLAGDLDWEGPPACLAEVLGLDAEHPVFAGRKDEPSGD